MRSCPHPYRRWGWVSGALMRGRGGGVLPRCFIEGADLVRGGDRNAPRPSQTLLRPTWWPTVSRVA
jgi:hypothetical protein